MSQIFNFFGPILKKTYNFPVKTSDDLF